MRSGKVSARSVCGFTIFALLLCGLLPGDLNAAPNCASTGAKPVLSTSKPTCNIACCSGLCDGNGVCLCYPTPAGTQFGITTTYAPDPETFQRCRKDVDCCDGRCSVSKDVPKQAAFPSGKGSSAQRNKFLYRCISK